MSAKAEVAVIENAIEQIARTLRLLKTIGWVPSIVNVELNSRNGLAESRGF